MTDWTHHRKYTPPADLASPKRAQSIYGPVYRMLVLGGQRHLNGPERIHRDQHGKPSKPRPVSHYEGEMTYAPDPNVSDLKSTWTLVCHMARRNWSRNQIETALLDPQNLGGEFYRFEVLDSKDGGRGFLSRMLERAYPVSPTLPLSASNVPTPYSPSNGEAIRGRNSTSTEQDRIGGEERRKASRGGEERDGVETWRISTKGFPLRQREAERMVEYIARADVASRTTNAISERGPLHRRVAGSYMKMLGERGIITRSEKVVQTARGKRRSMVAEIAEKGPLDLADRRLWRMGRDAARSPWATTARMEELEALLKPSTASGNPDHQR